MLNIASAICAGLGTVAVFSGVIFVRQKPKDLLKVSTANALAAIGFSFAYSIEIIAKLQQ